jgi:hypothetical protein
VEGERCALVALAAAGEDWRAIVDVDGPGG